MKGIVLMFVVIIGLFIPTYISSTASVDFTHKEFIFIGILMIEIAIINFIAFVKYLKK